MESSITGNPISTEDDTHTLMNYIQCGERNESMKSLFRRHANIVDPYNLGEVEEVGRVSV